MGKKFFFHEFNFYLLPAKVNLHIALVIGTSSAIYNKRKSVGEEKVPGETINNI